MPIRPDRRGTPRLRRRRLQGACSGWLDDSNPKNPQSWRDFRSTFFLSLLRYQKEVEFKNSKPSSYHPFPFLCFWAMVFRCHPHPIFALTLGHRVEQEDITAEHLEEATWRRVREWGMGSWKSQRFWVFFFVVIPLPGEGL